MVQASLTDQLTPITNQQDSIPPLKRINLDQPTYTPR